MSLVRLYMHKLLASFIIEIKNQFRICRIPFGRSYLLYRITVPKASRVTKGTYSAFRAHSRSCKHYQLFHTQLLFYVSKQYRYRKNKNF